MNDLRDETLATVLDRTAATIDAAATTELEQILHRGRRRRIVRFIAIGASLALFVGVLSWTGVWLRPSDEAAVPADDGGSTDTIRRLRDPEHGLTVSVPEGWVVADENLTPWLMSPSEILSMGTFPLRVSQDPEDGLRLFDAPVAPQALADMTAGDVFLSVQESGDFTGPPLPRPQHFGPRDCEVAVTGCEEDRYREIPFRAWWIPFEDAGRGLYLLVAIGNDATPELRDRAWGVVDSLVFEPLEP